MKDSEGLKTALCLLLSCPPSINYCLTDLFSLQTTPTSSKGTRGVAQSDSHYAKPPVNFPFTCSQSCERCTAQHADKCFICCFIQNIHKELRAGTQRAQATPPLLRIGWWWLWRQAGRHGNSLSDLLYIFCLARICGNVADDVDLF